MSLIILPEEVNNEIIQFLPLKSLLNLRLISKEWKNIIDKNIKYRINNGIILKINEKDIIKSAKKYNVKVNYIINILNILFFKKYDQYYIFCLNNMDYSNLDEEYYDFIIPTYAWEELTTIPGLQKIALIRYKSFNIDKKDIDTRSIDNYKYDIFMAVNNILPKIFYWYDEKYFLTYKDYIYYYNSYTGDFNKYYKEYVIDLLDKSILTVENSLELYYELANIFEKNIKKLKKNNNTLEIGDYELGKIKLNTKDEKYLLKKYFYNNI